MENSKKEEIQKKVKYAVDEQTGKLFELEPEEPWDSVAATFSILYLIAMLLFFSWLLIDIFCGKCYLLERIAPGAQKYLSVQLFRLIAYTVIGGAMGGVVNGIRGFVIWHAERKAFGWRFLWKYVTLPLVGMILAAIVYAAVRGGVAVFAGGVTSNGDTTIQGLSAFSIGSLTGYGSHKVFIWLDKHVNKLFKAPLAGVRVPDLIGKTQEEAEALLRDSTLNMGTVNKKPSEKPELINKVIDQFPPPDTMMPKGSFVDVIIGTKG